MRIITSQWVRSFSAVISEARVRICTRKRFGSPDRDMRGLAGWPDGVFACRWLRGDDHGDPQRVDI